MVSTLQAETTFKEGSRDAVTLHPSCRDENTGMTAIGVSLPNGPEIKVTIGKEKTSTIMTLPYPDALITTNRKGDVFNGNPIMGARPSFNQAGIFGADIITAPVAAYGRSSKTEDTKMVFWKLKGVNVYDMDSNTLKTLPYIPNGELVTVELGFALPKFAPDNCLVSMNVRGSQMARCEKIDPATKAILAGSEADIRKKRMRLTVERDLEKNPLPANCGEGITATIESTDAEAELLEAKLMAMTP